jgi:TusA-related sulfurtransferase
VTPAPLQCLDLRGIPCPQNYVRTRLALETLPPQGWLQVDLDAGEPESSVAEGLRGEGHLVLVEHLPQDGARLLIQRAP